jgi:hypothetical protein
MDKEIPTLYFKVFMKRLILVLPKIHGRRVKDASINLSWEKSRSEMVDQGFNDVCIQGVVG